MSAAPTSTSTRRAIPSGWSRERSAAPPSPRGPSSAASPSRSTWTSEASRRTRDLTMQGIQADRGNVTGSYDLMGVNGSVLPATVDEASREAGEELRCRILAGELRLDEDGRYRLALTARYDTGAGATYTRVLETVGTWRFLASALDDRSGEVSLLSVSGRATTAAVTRLSLVHRTRVPGSGPEGLEFTWVYIRRAWRR